MLIDLTMPIADHFRWPVDRREKKSDTFQATWIGWTVHGFTHVDAPRHMVPGGPTTTDLPLDRIVGRATIVDLTGIAPQSKISESQIREAGQYIEAGDIVLLKTCWDTVESVQTPEFWTNAPYLSRDCSHGTGPTRPPLIAEGWFRWSQRRGTSRLPGRSAFATPEAGRCAT